MKKVTDKLVTDKIKYLQDTLYVIGGKWKLPIIIAVYYGHSRFTDIKRCIPKISARVLSKELKELEANQLITRSVSEDNPNDVTYSSTPYIHTLHDVINTMTQWGRQHRAQLMGKLTE